MAETFFFYGTLMDADVLSTVIGRRPMASHAQPATLSGFRRLVRKGAPYPGIVPSKPDDKVKGILFDGLTPTDVRRLERFEGFAHIVEVMPVVTDGGETVEAKVFALRPGVKMADVEWDFETWRRRHKHNDLTWR